MISDWYSLPYDKYMDKTTAAKAIDTLMGVVKKLEKRITELEKDKKNETINENNHNIS
jgi:hypothetical protein